MIIAVTKRLFNPDLEWMVIEVTKRLFNPNLELWRPRAFSTSILTKGNQRAFEAQNWSCGDQGAFQPRSWRTVTKRLFNLDLDEREPRIFSISKLELWRTRGFLTSILKKKNQGAFQPWNQSCGGQGAFQLQSWWKITKGLFNLDLDKKEPRGFSTLEPELWRPKGFSTSILMKRNQGAF